MRPPERYWRKAAKRALKRLRISKPKPRVVRTTPPRPWGKQRSFWKKAR